MVKTGASLLAFVAAAAGPAMVVGFALSPSAMTSGARGRATGSSTRLSMMAAAEGKQRVLVIGGTRFSGLYLTKELHSRGHEVRTVRCQNSSLEGSPRYTKHVYRGKEDVCMYALLAVRMHVRGKGLQHPFSCCVKKCIVQASKGGRWGPSGKRVFVLHDQPQPARNQMYCCDV